MKREDIEKAAHYYVQSLAFGDSFSDLDIERAFIAGVDWFVANIWHDSTEIPKIGEHILVRFRSGSMTSWFTSADIIDVFKRFDVIKWTYLLPENKER